MKRWHVFLLISTILCCTVIGYELYGYYAPPAVRQPYQLPIHEEDTLRIAYIGDSWAFMHRNHDCQIARILADSLHRPIKVHSYGICGLTSKEIYENLFDNADMKHFMLKRNYKYCFISAGINDTYKKMSTSYYQHSMDAIIQFLLANDIRPIILEIPDYDIVKAYNLQRTNRKLLRRASMLITCTQMDCKRDFRNALHELIKEKGYQDKVDVIQFKEWNNNYQKDLQMFYRSDGMHLNQEGYLRLDSIIVRHILNRFSL